MSKRDTQPTSPRLARSAGRGVFGENAAGYDSARLGYPTEIYDRIFTRVGKIEHPAILEIGAGTGLASRDLLARCPSMMVAVEPDAQMAGFLASMLGAAAELTIRNCPFEDAVLSPASFDLAAAAASFHWLEPVPALAKVRTALKPGGVIALWWNVYRATGIGDEFADALSPLLDGLALPPSEGECIHHSLNAERYRNLLEAGGFGRVEHTILRRERILGASEMRALYETYSFVRLLPDPERLRLLDRIAELVETRFGGGAPNIVLTALYTAIKADRG